jgi:hypothetical protein
VTLRKGLSLLGRLSGLSVPLVFLALAWTLALPQAVPAATFTWSATGSMTTSRQNSNATLLPNGQVLVAGGHFYLYSLNTAELYNAAPTGLVPGIFELLLLQ